MPACLALEITTPPLEGLIGRGARRHIDQAVTARENAVRDRVLAAGRPFLGRRAVIQQNPFASPATNEPRRDLSPRVASRNKWLRIETLARCAEFACQYREALAAWCERKRHAVFPVGTYLMRVRHLVRCAEA